MYRFRSTPLVLGFYGWLETFSMSGWVVGLHTPWLHVSVTNHGAWVVVWR